MIGGIIWQFIMLSYQRRETQSEKALIQWCSHWGVKGGRVPPLNAKNVPKIGKKREKSGKIRKKRQKSRRFFHFASPDRAGYATALINNANNWQICLHCNSAVHNILLTRFSEHPQTRVPPEDIIQEFTLGQAFSKGGVQKHTGLWCSLCGPQTSIFDMFWPFMAWTMIENPWLRPYFSHRFLYQNLKLGPAGKYFLMPSSQTNLLYV